MYQPIKMVDKEELQRYKDSVSSFLSGDLNDDQFMATRLQQGIYGQRQDGVNMVRAKLPGGRISAQQLAGVAEVLETYSDESFASVTTRQDIQLHTIPLEKTPDALNRLADFELTSREACGNTVRNITACPLAGVCPKEHTDVQHYVEQTAQRYLRSPLTQHMPRKIKMSFSGCESDCAQGMIHDIAAVAVNRYGKHGFKILAAGGLGHKPRPAIVVEEFVEEKSLLAVIEALLSVHNKYSDRKRRARARFKFLAEKLGTDGFLDKYREEYARTKEIFVETTLQKGEWHPANIDSNIGSAGTPYEVVEQKQIGLYVVPIGLTLGDLTVETLNVISATMLRHGISEARATQDQNLMLLNVPADKLSAIQTELAQYGLVEPKASNDVVACPGTWTCRLGITSSRVLTEKLHGVTDLKVRVSGCHNGCAQPYLGDIGMYGEGRRLHGKLIPHYRMYFGGDGRANGSIAIKGPEVPSARAVPAVQRVYKTFKESQKNDESFTLWARRQEKNFFDELLKPFSTVNEYDIPLVAKDHGEEDGFRVLQLGGGECMGAPQETVAANFSESAHEREYRRTFTLAKKNDQAVDCAESITRIIGQSILYVLGKKEPITDLREIEKALAEELPAHDHLLESMGVFIGELERFKANFDDAGFAKLAEAQDVWTMLAAEFCQSKDGNLNLSASLPEIAPLAQAS